MLQGKEKARQKNKSLQYGRRKRPRANFITRSAARSKLQINGEYFRRLCVLKGIHPKEASKKQKNKGSDKVYYSYKDIKYMAHDPIINDMREISVWQKKFDKVKSQRVPQLLKDHLAKKPTKNLSHLVRERYPTFIDALRDLDDALSLIFTYSFLPNVKFVKSASITACQNLGREFKYYVIRSHSLRKAYVTIKGIYYQAEIMGQTINWIEPHKFQMAIPKEVDRKLMSYFIEFYETLLGFVNFKLYSTFGFNYPPTYSDDNSELCYTKFRVVSKIDTLFSSDNNKDSAEKKKEIENTKSRISTLDDTLRKVVSEGGGAEQTSDKDTEEEKVAPEKLEKFELEQHNMGREEEIYANLFKSLVFFLGRETPRESLEFVLTSFGATVVADPNLEDITHFVVDRNSVEKQHLDKEYIVPQWVYDSLNNKILLPVERYAPGIELPPHLSPFVNDKEEGYVPEYRQVLDKLIESRGGILSLPEQETSLLGIGTVVEDDMKLLEERFARDIEAERKGVYLEDNPEEEKEKLVAELTRKRKAGEQEEKDLGGLAVALLPNKKRRLVTIFNKDQKKKSDAVKKLKRKRKEQQKKKEQQNNTE
eukprot:TRINITY_DN156_c0_g1_i1.p1 TRINITY_DN156_c0_g1~~TRINITY_DN156_c0_g1_i1.p1  ORF type:complete len:594 (-),score=118.31 TRINITY_DN156_c0_g1_i1:98-1879(-)